MNLVSSEAICASVTMPCTCSMALGGSRKPTCLEVIPNGEVNSVLIVAWPQPSTRSCQTVAVIELSVDESMACNRIGPRLRYSHWSLAALSPAFRLANAAREKLEAANLVKESSEPLLYANSHAEKRFAAGVAGKTPPAACEAGIVPETVAQPA